MPRWAAPRPVPLEAEEQLVVVQWLTFRQHLFFHCANQSRSARAGVLNRRLGAKAGVPDLLVLSPPTRPAAPGSVMRARHGLWVGTELRRRCSRCLGVEPFKGAAVEIKRLKGGRVSPMQKQWLADLDALGWYAVVARGAQEAIRALTLAGY